MMTPQQTPVQPFQCTVTPGVPELLSELNISLLLSTYQAGKLIALSPYEGGLIQLPRNFDKPMGLAVTNDGDGIAQKMAVATRHEVVILHNDAKLTRVYPQPGKYDGLFAPRAVYFVNEVDVHDMVWVDDTLWAVNTLFGCLCTIDHDFSFRPQWQPAFLSELAPEDRCHLNGMAIVDGQPEWVTALGTTNSALGWRENRVNGGVLMHVPSNEIVISNLGMPHSPRVYDGKVYFLISLTGELVVADPERGTYDQVAQVPGFVRGLARHGDYLFIGMSKIRPGRVLGDLPIDRDKLKPGVAIVHMHTGEVIGMLQYETDCEEIYDVQVLAGLRRPGIIGLGGEHFRSALTTPGQAFWGKPLDERPSDDGKPRGPGMD